MGPYVQGRIFKNHLWRLDGLAWGLLYTPKKFGKVDIYIVGTCKAVCMFVRLAKSDKKYVFKFIPISYGIGPKLFIKITSF